MKTEVYQNLGGFKMKDDEIQVISMDRNDKGLTQSEMEKYADRTIGCWIFVVGSCWLFWGINGLKKLRWKRK